MTVKSIKKILTSLNQSKPGGYIVTRPLTDEVDYAKVWPGLSSLEEPKVNRKDNEAPYTFYFLADNTKRYTAAVCVLENNLQWYLLPELRKGNLFSTLLKETVLPHILQHKPVQRLELNRPIIGEKVFILFRKIALSTGFTLVKERGGISLFAIEAASVGLKTYISGLNIGISKDRAHAIEAELQKMIQRLDIIRTEMIMKTGDWSSAMDYEKIIESLKERIEDNFSVE